ncbi:SDR family oxidoreductase [Halalkalibacter akibai]|uniref:Oxidoreductase n=1 Tax=Halalkalibacter akibai (strain ATCC 43226 / DSM 21942 / CIP 109018 / JCM 9157 / 1139) TaxID=1236973 RepID=W4QQN3_HALA3|nr:SDR family oxidoreductase [Halalkalibacter akibai]GAE34242.1 oxidoreductase [Halalkalibacter akibai JCM 9157]
MNKQTIMITGASKGLGKSLALYFAEKGANLALCARDEKALKIVQQEIELLGVDVVVTVADVSSEKDVERFVSIAEQHFGRIDTLINNASIFGPGPLYLADYPEREFETVIKTNIMNPFLVTKRVLPGMLARGTGSIINLTSEVGQTGYAEWGAYAVSKFAIEGMTQVWADELASTGIRINLVDPGEMDTSMHEIAVPDCDYELTHPSDVVEVFGYLASDESIGITGQRYQAQNFEREGLS